MLHARLIRLAILIWISVSCTVASAEDQENEDTAINLILPVFDYPFNQVHGVSYPSYQQSLNVTRAFYQIPHHSAAYYWGEDHPILTTSGIVLFDVYFAFFPYSSAWLHEEWHRGVLTNRQIDSYNGIYDMSSEATVPVKNIRDEELVRLKAEHPAEMVQLHAAGLNAQAALNFSMEKDAFFFNKSRWDLPNVWLNYLMNNFYLYTCSDGDGDLLTDELYDREDTDISARDFTGMDCNGWVYDLHRPNEAYNERGSHPSGVGIDRYIKTTDLTNEEWDYLKLQTRLNLINLINPYLFGKMYFSAINPLTQSLLRWTFSLKHQLAPFGYTLGANILVKQDIWNVVLTGLIYQSENQTLPGIEAELVHFPLKLLHQPSYFNARIAMWLQPKNQLFASDEWNPGGSLSLGLTQMFTERLGVYAETQIKTQGWIADTLHLQNNLNARVGIFARMF
ncbi:MAG: hypothetical protein OEX19_09405 [Gammaproteobacteria bacterium]|nr:hypothetical protein [Gammaproteobacteria bacterium]